MKAWKGQAFGGNVKKLDFALTGSVLDQRRFFGIQSAIEQFCRDTVGSQAVDLVFHQGDERRDHQSEPFKAKGWELIAEGLAAPGGHQNQGVVPGKHLGDDLFLEGQESIEPEI